MVRPASTFGTRNTKFHLYSNENYGRTKDYMFLDQQVRNYIEFGGAQFFVIKLMGYRNPDGSISDINTIQDPVLMENPNGRISNIKVYEGTDETGTEVSFGNTTP